MQPACQAHPPSNEIQALQALTRLTPKAGLNWNVLAYILNRDLIKSDGTTDDLYGLVFPLGAFADQANAEAHAKKIIEKTGYRSLVVAHYGKPVKLTVCAEPQTVEVVPVDLQGKLLELSQQQYEADRQVYEERLAREQALLEEMKKEADPDQLEHFKSNCYLAIKARENYHHFQQEADRARQAYEKYRSNLRAHHKQHPQHEAEFLPFFKQKLYARGEQELYQLFEPQYLSVKDELLGLASPKAVGNHSLSFLMEDQEDDQSSNSDDSHSETSSNNTSQTADSSSKSSIQSASSSPSPAQHSDDFDDCSDGVCRLSPTDCAEGICLMRLPSVEVTAEQSIFN